MYILQDFVRQQSQINERQSATINKQSAFIEELSVTVEKQSETINNQAALIQQLHKDSRVRSRQQEKTNNSMIRTYITLLAIPGK